MKKTLFALAIGISSLSNAIAAPVQWAENGHWYEFVSEAVTWDTAFSAANSASYDGLQGYLATITSAEENLFVSSDIAGGSLAGLGGSDNGAANVNDWTWRNGPESGDAFTYTNWNGGEPNNCCGGEDYLHTNWGSVSYWNDHGGPGNPGQINGYVIEYSAMVPEPATYAMLLAGLVMLGINAKRRQAIFLTR